MRVKEEREKAGLKLSIQTTKVMASCSITSRQIEEEKVEAVTRFFFSGLQNHYGMVTAATKLKGTFSLKGKL